jgi:ATP-dependent RNA helicase DDX47/RRP3
VAVLTEDLGDEDEDEDEDEEAGEGSEQDDEEQEDDEDLEDEEGDEELAGSEEDDLEGDDDDAESTSNDILHPTTASSDPIELENTTFATLGLIPELVKATTALSFTKPTPIQAKSLPPALLGKDIIGLAQTGSGKTAAFLLPILQSLFTSANPTPFYALVLAPTRELAYQIDQTLKALGAGIGVRSTVLVGGMDMMQQSVSLGKRPHVIVATPGRLMDHLENTKGFSLRNLKYLVSHHQLALLSLEFCSRLTLPPFGKRSR